MKCRAKQYSDQMSCDCGNTWDMNDPCPPECKERHVENTRDTLLAVGGVTVVIAIVTFYVWLIFG